VANQKNYSSLLKTKEQYEDEERVNKIPPPDFGPFPTHIKGLSFSL
jgi:hypothetical protein